MKDDWRTVDCVALGSRHVLQKKLRQFKEWKGDSEIHIKATGFLSLSALLAGFLTSPLFFSRNISKEILIVLKHFFELSTYTWCQKRGTMI